MIVNFANDSHEFSRESPFVKCSINDHYTLVHGLLKYELLWKQTEHKVQWSNISGAVMKYRPLNLFRLEGTWQTCLMNSSGAWLITALDINYKLRNNWIPPHACCGFSHKLLAFYANSWIQKNMVHPSLVYLMLYSSHVHKPIFRSKFIFATSKIFYV
jgi:hypothetical protein